MGTCWIVVTMAARMSKKGRAVQARTETATLLRRMDKDIRAAEQEMEALQKYVGGLRAARDQLMSATERQPRSEQSSGSRTALLLDILQHAEHPMSADDLLIALKERGREDDKRLVNSTVSYLKRKGEAQNVSPGKWAIAA